MGAFDILIPSRLAGVVDADMCQVTHHPCKASVSEDLDTWAAAARAFLAFSLEVDSQQSLLLPPEWLPLKPFSTKGHRFAFRYNPGLCPMCVNPQTALLAPRS